MATISYYVIEGELRSIAGAAMSSQKTEFLADGVGSVVRTTISNGPSGLTQRFASYGVRLGSQPTAFADARLGWRGSWRAYRRTAAGAAGVYAPAGSHYSTSTGAWCTGARSFDSQLPDCTLGKGEPAHYYSVDYPPTPRLCSGYGSPEAPGSWKIKWQPPEGKSGVIIQRITIGARGCKNGVTGADECKFDQVQYYEVWNVVQGSIAPYPGCGFGPAFDDVWYDKNKCCCNSSAHTGAAATLFEFADNSNRCKKKWNWVQLPGQSLWGCLYGGTDPPWGYDPREPGATIRRELLTWTCCGSKPVSCGSESICIDSKTSVMDTPEKA